MARNELPKSLAQLFALGDDMEDGLVEIGDAVGVVQNTAAVIGAALAAARTAESVFQTARQNRVAKTSLQTTADSNAKAFIGKTKRHLIDSFGEKWTTEWAQVGFVNGSLAVPGDQDGRFSLLFSMKNFLTAQPAYENAGSGITAAAATLLHTAVSNARTQVNAAKALVGEKFADREDDVETLKTRMRGLIGELDTLLSDDDPRWHAFGLNAPGDPETPGIPGALVLTAGAAGTGTLLADWDDARRAEYYRVWRKLPGEMNFSAISTVEESDAILNGQPLGVAIEIRVTAVNEAGESVPGAVAVITLS